MFLPEDDSSFTLGTLEEFLVGPGHERPRTAAGYLGPHPVRLLQPEQRHLEDAHHRPKVPRGRESTVLGRAG